MRELCVFSCALFSHHLLPRSIAPLPKCKRFASKSMRSLFPPSRGASASRVCYCYSCCHDNPICINRWEENFVFSHFLIINKTQTFRLQWALGEKQLPFPAAIKCNEKGRAISHDVQLLCWLYSMLIHRFLWRKTTGYDARFDQLKRFSFLDQENMMDMMAVSIYIPFY